APSTWHSELNLYRGRARATPELLAAGNGPAADAVRKDQTFETHLEVSAMAKGVFERKKPHVNVGTIGHIDHGKTTLTAALSARSQAKYGTTAKNYKDIAKGGIDRDATKTVTIAAAHVEYESE